jgi:hypothetical protein
MSLYEGTNDFHHTPAIHPGGRERGGRMMEVIVCIVGIALFLALALVSRDICEELRRIADALENRP